MMSYILIALGLLFGIVGFLIFRGKSQPKPAPEQVHLPQLILSRKISVSYGGLNIFFASQTGTAAKLADQFGKEAEQNGFIPEVIDLKDCEQKHFNGSNICVFLLSNTGEGDPPDNSVEFMKALNGKSEQKEIKFSRVRFTVFGLGNTQYQFYNRTAKDVDSLLVEKHKAKRVFKLGLGDNNASLQDDYVEWKSELWPELKKCCQQVVTDEPEQLKSQQNIMTEKLINLATWRFVQSHNKEFKIGDEFTGGYDLEFLTRGHLLSQPAEIRNSHEVRQNNLDGSSLLLEIEPLINKTYKTAGNLAVYPENDPEMVEKVARHFNLDMNALYEVEFDKKCKLPFCTPISMRTLLTSCIDLQRPVTKSLLKNLGKLPSRDPKYFQDNSSVKTTKEYSRLTSTMHYLFKFIEHYQVEMTFETFVSLSDAIAPRLFTIASSPLVYPTSIHIVDSLEDEGLCSKFFKRNPKQVRVEVKESTFQDAMQNEKVIFISAGTGFAPFKGYLEEKQILLKQGKLAPVVSLFFGCRHQEGDFIFKKEIQTWINNGIINKFYPAFSRDTEKKVYVQDLLAENKQEVIQFLANENSKLYCCGSLPMGNSVNQTIVAVIETAEKLQKPQAKERLLQLQKKGRIIKELW